MHLSIIEMINKYGATEATREFFKEHQLQYIDGQFCEGSAGDRLNVIEPSTGQYLTSIPACTTDDIDRAAHAARAALEGEWGTMKPNERSRIMHKIADLIEEHAQTMGEIETLDNGKAIGPCVEMDILDSAELFRYMAGFATKIHGETRQVSAPGNNFAMTVKEPIGVVAAIVPWNWPFSMASWKMAAALAAGCTMVVKPAQQTSLSMIYFAKLLEQADLPKGVLNIVVGKGSAVGDHISAHPEFDKVSFTGSTDIGRRVGEIAGRNLKPATLELGGKSPMIVFEDANFDDVAEACRWSIFFNAGQICSGGSRMYVQRSVFGQVVDTVKKKTEDMKMAPGLDPDCDIGPVISSGAKLSIESYIQKGLDEGGKLICGGLGGVPDHGYFVRPTIITTDDNKATIVQEEIFGPVLVMVPFETEEEAIELANDNSYGLASSVWTKDISRALRMVPKIKAGTVWINAHDYVDSCMPCGGFKDSGYGKDMGPEQLDYFTKTKAVWVAI